MGKFVLAYRGGGVPATPEEGEKVMAAWMDWFGKMGDAVADHGNPFGASKTVAANGVVSDGGGAGLTGYSIVSAAAFAAACELASGCPILAIGGTVDVYEAMDM